MNEQPSFRAISWARLRIFAAQPQPLHNRAAAKPAVAEKGGAGGVDRAAKIRNRAQEIARKDGCSFTAAFRCAEQEFGATS